MAKARLYLGNITSKNWAGDSTILCKQIHTIHVDGEVLKRSDCGDDSMVIQDFYRKIIKNSDKITYVKFGKFYNDNNYEYTEYYLKNKKLHCLSGFAKSHTVFSNKLTDNRGEYYIDGVKHSKTEWEEHPFRIKWLRVDKLNRVLKEVE